MTGLGHLLHTAGPLLSLTFLLFAGLVTLLPTIYVIHQGIASRSWPCTTCTIQSSRIELEDDSGSIRYAPRVTYCYQVDGAELCSDRIRFACESQNDRRTVQRTISRYRKGARALVYYNPKHPQQSVLEPGFEPQVVEEDLARGFFCLATGLGLLLALIAQ